MAATGFADTGARLGGLPFSTTMAIYGQLVYDVSRSNNTVTFSNFYAQGQHVRIAGSATSFTYSTGWDVVGDAPSGSQRVSGGWSGTRSVNAVDSTGATSFTVGVGANDTSMSVRAGARYRNDGVTYAWFTIGIPTLGAPSLSSQSVSNIKPRTATVNASYTAGDNATLSNIELQYGTTLSYGSSMSIAGNTTSSYFNLSELTPGATYNYRFVLTNGGGKVTTTSNYTFKTQSISGMLPLLMGLL